MILWRRPLECPWETGLVRGHVTICFQPVRQNPSQCIVMKRRGMTGSSAEPARPPSRGIPSLRRERNRCQQRLRYLNQRPPLFISPAISIFDLPSKTGAAAEISISITLNYLNSCFVHPVAMTEHSLLPHNTQVNPSV